MSRYSVIKDTREKANSWYFEEDNFCTGTISRKLNTGDYSLDGLEDILCIERKASVAELAQNITQDRFKAELERMESFQFCFLICEFSEDDILIFPKGSNIPVFRHKYVKISPNFLISFLDKLSYKRDIPVLLCGDYETAQTITSNIFRYIWQIHH